MKSQSEIFPSCIAQHGQLVYPVEINTESAPGNNPFMYKAEFNSQVIKHRKYGLVIKMLTNLNQRSTSRTAIIFLQFPFIHNA